MRKYYCKNGEVVTVYPNPNNSQRILVKYRGKVYDRPIEAIGKTLFSEKPTVAQVGSRIYLSSLDINAELAVQVVPTKVEAKYRGMGGSYYGARVDLINTIDSESVSDDIISISKNSPIGKAVLGKTEGDVIAVKCPDKRVDRYRIMKIEFG